MKNIHESATIGQNVFVGENVQISENVSIEPGVYIGDNVKVGIGAVIKANSVVVKDVPAYSVILGNPSYITDYVNKENEELNSVVLYRFPKISDFRGSLTFGEFGKSIPFEVKRFFTIFDVRYGYSRGDHSHKECHQFIICQRGTVEIVCDDGKKRKKFVLRDPSEGIHVKPGVWTSLFNFSEDSIVTVFASEFYDESDYIRDYQKFRESRVNE